MGDLSVFVDESGNMGRDSKYYLLTLLFHDQDDEITPLVVRYERSLLERELADVPFHFAPLLRGNGPYDRFIVEDRYKMLKCFKVFCEVAPIRYCTFLYCKDHFENMDRLKLRMKRDLVAFLFDHIDSFQRFDRIKIYYDDGQRIITHVFHHAFELVVGKQTVMYREAQPADYRLAQMADFICGVELAAVKYQNKEVGPSEERFLGTWKDFKNNFLKKVRRKLLQ